MIGISRQKRHTCAMGHLSAVPVQAGTVVKRE